MQPARQWNIGMGLLRIMVTGHVWKILRMENIMMMDHSRKFILLKLATSAHEEAKRHGDWRLYLNTNANPVREKRQSRSLPEFRA